MFFLRNRILALLLCVCILLNLTVIELYADSSSSQEAKELIHLDVSNENHDKKNEDLLVLDVEQENSEQEEKPAFEKSVLLDNTIVSLRAQEKVLEHAQEVSIVNIADRDQINQIANSILEQLDPDLGMYIDEISLFEISASDEDGNIVEPNAENGSMEIEFKIESKSMKDAVGVIKVFQTKDGTSMELEAQIDYSNSLVKIHADSLSTFAIIVLKDREVDYKQRNSVSQRPQDGTTKNHPFIKGTAGSESFRIPVLYTLDDGSLLAAADARWNTTYDGGGLDTIVSRSEDEGENWSYHFANYFGDNGNEYNAAESTTFIDPAIAQKDGIIYLIADLYPYGVALNGLHRGATPLFHKPEEKSGFNQNGKLRLINNRETYYLEDGKIYNENTLTPVEGYDVDEHFNIRGHGVDTNLFFKESPFQVERTSFLYLVTSKDGGRSWSAPKLLPLKNDREMAYLIAPGRGLVTSSGRIVFACYSFNGDESSQKMDFIYSDDGENWQRMEGPDTNGWSSESAVVELKDGTLRFFYRNGSSRLNYVDYKDEVWQKPVKTDVVVNSNCQLSAITYSKEYLGKQLILISAPTGRNSAGSNISHGGPDGHRLNGRIFMGIVEDDQNMTWLDEHHIKVNDNNAQFMYSCITELKDGKIGILYEDHQNGWGTGDDKYYTMAFKTYHISHIDFDGSKIEQSDIEVSKIPAKKYGDPSFTLEVSGGSTDAPFVYSSLTPDVLSVSGNEIGIIGAGQGRIKISKAGDDRYKTVEKIVTIDVAKAKLTIKAKDVTFKQNSSQNFKSLECEFTGLVNGDQFGYYGKPVVSHNVQNTHTVGEFILTPSGGYLQNGADSHYEKEYLQGTLTIEGIDKPHPNINKPQSGTTKNNPFPKGTATSNSFRIPALVTLANGDLLAAADIRWNTTYDGGGLDTLVSISKDQGENWEYDFANYLGDNGNAYNGKKSTTFIDPALAVDGDTVYLLTDLYPYGIALNGNKDGFPDYVSGFDDKGRLLLKKEGEREYQYHLDPVDSKIKRNDGGFVDDRYIVDEHFNITGNKVNTNLFFDDAPYKVQRTSYLYLVKSTDGGKSWSAPKLIPLKTSMDRAYLVAPGRGLVTTSGVIVFPTYSNTEKVEKVDFIYSEDKGNTWKRSEFAPIRGSLASESSVVELRDGTLRFFFRSRNSVLTYIDYKDGKWKNEVRTNIPINSNCELSAIKYSRTIGGKDVLFISAPTGPNRRGSNNNTGGPANKGGKRLNGSIFVGIVNEDNTMDWKLDSTIIVNENEAEFMYSCLTQMSDGKLALLYENHQEGWGAGDHFYYTMDFKTFSVDQLGFDKLEQSDLKVTDITQKFYGDAEFELEITGGSGSGALQIENITPEIISVKDNRIEILKAGAARIKIVKAEDKDYREKSLMVEFPIGKKALRVKANDIKIKVGEKMPSFSYQLDGLLSKDKILKEPTLNAEVQDTKNEGIYSIKIEGLEVENKGSYEITYQEGRLHIEKKDLKPPVTPNHSDSSDSGGAGLDVNSSVRISQTKKDIKEKSDVSAFFDPQTKKAQIDSKSTSLQDVKKALAEISKLKEKGAKTIILRFHITQDSKETNIETLEFSKQVIEAMNSSDLDRIQIISNQYQISLKPSTLNSMKESVNADLLLSAKKIETEASDIKEKGNYFQKPIYDFSFTSSNGEKVKKIENDRVNISFVYPLNRDEKSEQLLIRYIDENKESKTVAHSIYNEKTHTLDFATNMFGTFGIFEKQQEQDFEDIEHHWSKTSIHFVSVRDLFKGISQDAFAPNTSMSTEMFITVLGRLDQVDVKKFEEVLFKDLDKNRYSTPYINWASQNNIIGEMSDGVFSPETHITREQMAQIIYQYAKTTKFDVTQEQTPVSYRDSGDISSYAREAVDFITSHGIMNGKQDGKFDPGSVATRAEVAAILERLIKLSLH